MDDIVLTPFGVELSVTELDPLDRMELNESGVALSTRVTKKDGWKKYTVIMNLQNAKDLAASLNHWIEQEEGRY